MRWLSPRPLRASRVRNLLDLVGPEDRAALERVADLAYSLGKEMKAHRGCDPGDCPLWNPDNYRTLAEFGQTAEELAEGYDDHQAKAGMEMARLFVIPGTHQA